MKARRYIETPTGESHYLVGPVTKKLIDMGNEFRDEVKTKPLARSEKDNLSAA